MVGSILTPNFLQTKNTLAVTTYFISDKFLTGIHFSTLFTLFRYLVTKVISLLRRVEIFILPVDALFKSDTDEWDFQYDLLVCPEGKPLNFRIVL